MTRVLLSLAVVGLTGCEEPRLCDMAEASFVVERRSAVRIALDLSTRGRHDATASYQGSWAHAAEPRETIAVAIVGPGTDRGWDGAFSGGFQVHAREPGHRVEVLIQRLDHADVVIEGEVSAEAHAPATCSLDLEVVPD